MKNKTSKFYYFSILAFWSILGMTGCQEDMLPEEKSNTFYKVYNHLWGTGSDIIESSDGGVLIACNIVSDTIAFSTGLLKTNAQGQTQWGGPLIITPYPTFPVMAALHDGTFLVSHRDNGRILRIDEADGEIIYDKRFGDDISFGGPGNYSKPLKQGNFIYISVAYPNDNHLYRIDYLTGDTDSLASIPNGTYVSSSDLTISSVRDLDVYRIDNETAWLRATATLDYSGDTTYFVQVLLELNLNTKSIIKATQLSEGGFEVVDGEYGRSVTNGENVYVHARPYNEGNNINNRSIPGGAGDTKFKVYKADKNMSPLWVKEFNLGGASINVNEMSPTKEGGVLIVGTRSTGGPFGKPYLLKLDQHGNVVYLNFDYPSNTQANAAKTFSDGAIYITGNTLAKGIGIDRGGIKPLLLKTNSQGKGDF